MKMDSGTAAKDAGLVLSDRTVKGISRKMIKVKAKKDDEKDSFYWDYYGPDKKKIQNEERISFFNSLVVPPAWEEVWFCPDEKGHIQATGKDAKGRTQYRYHPEWIKKKSDLKFSNIDEFAKYGLVSIRDRVSDDLKLEKMSKHKSAALVIRLMDLFHIRVGSDQYAKENESYGLTTLTEGHCIPVTGDEAEGEIDVIFDFTGKSGKHWRLLIEDDNLSKMIEESRHIGDLDSSQDLFMFLDENDNPRDLKAEHINEYLDECTDAKTKYTAKDFRTWAASWKTAARLILISEATEDEINQIPELFEQAEKNVQGTDWEGYPIIFWKGLHLRRAKNLAKLAKSNKLPGISKKERTASMLAVIDTVAGDLGNTRAVCRSSYIRPMIMDDWENNTFLDRWNSVKNEDLMIGLSKEESITAIYMNKFEK